MVADTQIQYYGCPLLIAVPVNAEKRPSEIAKEFNEDFKRITERAKLPTLKDFYQAQREITRRIEAGEPLVEN